MELTGYIIPHDLDKTFTIEVVFGSTKVMPQAPTPPNRPK